MSVVACLKDDAAQCPLHLLPIFASLSTCSCGAACLRHCSVSSIDRARIAVFNRPLPDSSSPLFFGFLAHSWFISFTHGVLSYRQVEDVYGNNTSFYQHIGAVQDMWSISRATQIDDWIMTQQRILEEEEQQEELLRVCDHGNEESRSNGIELVDVEDEQDWTSQQTYRFPWGWTQPKLITYLSHPASYAHFRRRRSTLGNFARILLLLPYIVTGLVIVCGTFFPSYSSPPARYTALREQVERSLTRTGQANPHDEKIFIAASLYDPAGVLVGGDWGKAMASLIEILGPRNVHFSLYENDADAESIAAVQTFKTRLTCNTSVVVEDLDLSQLAHVSTPDGKLRLKRVAYLAEVRNRALRPLEDEDSPASRTRFDKLLYVNDIVFDPVDAANLLFSTNVDEDTGKTRYHAACATDFVNPMKFYDTFATRDTEGYSMGVPFYPWFTSAGAGTSRSDVLAQKDAVRVKSCWGGMVAFEARWFQSWGTASTNPGQQVLRQPLHFRAENDTYWDSSECCLVHADLAARISVDSEGTTLHSGDPGIFMNPYIRVAYSTSTLRWLRFTRRFERLYPPLHLLVNWLSHRPGHNPRRLEQPGHIVTDRVWAWSAAARTAMRENQVVGEEGLQGTFNEVQRIAMPGSFCGGRNLLYINEEPLEGEGKWGNSIVPADD